MSIVCRPNAASSVMALENTYDLKSDRYLQGTA